jgi:exonuclease VII large subunit
MARKNSLKVAKARHDHLLEREREEQERLKRRAERRAEQVAKKMDTTTTERRPMKRKAARRLSNEQARLLKKGFKLVKPEETVDMDDGARPGKRLRRE